MCGCNKSSQTDSPIRTQSKEVTDLLNKWIVDNSGRKLLVQSPIYDVYNDIIGFITKSEKDSVVRIFKKNVVQVLD